MRPKEAKVDINLEQPIHIDSDDREPLLLASRTETETVR